MKGFIALFSVIIIATMLLLMAVGGSLSGYYSEMSTVAAESKQQSAALAEACVDETLRQLSLDSTYVGSATTTLGSYSCYSGTVTTLGSQKTFTTQGFFNHSYTSLTVTVNAATLGIVAYQEVVQ